MKDVLFERAAAFTGHRDIATSEYEDLTKRLFLTVDRLYREGVTTYYCGGALGFDTIAAVTVLSMPEMPRLTIWPIRELTGWTFWC